MKVRFEDLAQQLKSKLSGIYLISGDEPLQSREACDLVRSAARDQGFNERHVFHTDKGFEWEQLLATANSLSLFADRQFIELRMSNGKPSDKGKALQTYLENPSPDCVLLIITEKLDSASQRTAWFKDCEKQGVFVQVWPVEPRQLPGWIQQRMRARGLQPNREAVQLIAERVEGNMLAAAQEVDKLALLNGEGAIDEQVVLQSVADSARYDMYALVDAALLGDSKRVVRMLDGLKGEGAESILILWALTRELRSLHAMALKMSRGSPAPAVVNEARVWPKRKNAVVAGLNRHPPMLWAGLLQQSAKIDQIIKGLRAGNVWDELLQLCLNISGVPVLQAVEPM